MLYRLKLLPLPLFWLLLLLFLNALARIQTDKRMRVIFQQAKTEFNPYFMQNYTVVLKHNGTAIDVQFNVARDMERDIWLDVSIAVHQPKKQSYRILLSSKINFCNILGRKESYYLSLPYYWMKNVYKYGNFPKGCPLKKGNYFIHNLHIDRMSIPNFLLNGKYRVKGNYYLRSEVLTQPTISLTNLTLSTRLK